MGFKINNKWLPIYQFNTIQHSHTYSVGPFIQEGTIAFKADNLTKFSITTYYMTNSLTKMRKRFAATV